jgi:hypothetical protein
MCGSLETEGTYSRLVGRLRGRAGMAHPPHVLIFRSHIVRTQGLAQGRLNVGCMLQRLPRNISLASSPQIRVESHSPSSCCRLAHLRLSHSGRFARGSELESISVMANHGHDTSVNGHNVCQKPDLLVFQLASLPFGRISSRPSSFYRLLPHAHPPDSKRPTGLESDSLMMMMVPPWE